MLEMSPCGIILVIALSLIAVIATAFAFGPAALKTAKKIEPPIMMLMLAALLIGLGFGSYQLVSHSQHIVPCGSSSDAPAQTTVNDTPGTEGICKSLLDFDS